MQLMWFMHLALILPWGCVLGMSIWAETQWQTRDTLGTLWDEAIEELVEVAVEKAGLPAETTDPLT